MYTRKMQKAIHCLIADIAECTGHTTVKIREALKYSYWGDREGKMTLSLGEMKYIDAKLFYEYLFDMSLDLGVEYGTWAIEEGLMPKSPLT